MNPAGPTGEDAKDEDPPWGQRRGSAGLAGASRCPAPRAPLPTRREAGAEAALACAPSWPASGDSPLDPRLSPLTSLRSARPDRTRGQRCFVPVAPACRTVSDRREESTLTPCVKEHGPRGRGAALGLVLALTVFLSRTPRRLPLCLPLPRNFPLRALPAWSPHHCAQTASVSHAEGSTPSFFQVLCRRDSQAYGISRRRSIPSSNSLSILPMRTRENGRSQAMLLRLTPLSSVRFNKSQARPPASTGVLRNRAVPSADTRPPSCGVPRCSLTAAAITWQCPGVPIGALYTLSCHVMHQMSPARKEAQLQRLPPQATQVPLFPVAI